MVINGDCTQYPASLAVDKSVTPPPPVFWTQNPCFLEVAGGVALQNRQNKEVACKIFLNKELRAVFGFSWPHRAGMIASEDDCATKRGNNLQGQ
jgi:hypothetical protein